MVLAAGQTAFIVAVRAKAGGGGPIRGEQAASAQPQGPLYPTRAAGWPPGSLSCDLANLMGLLLGQALEGWVTGLGRRPCVSGSGQHPHIADTATEAQAWARAPPL